MLGSLRSSAYLPAPLAALVAVHTGRLPPSILQSMQGFSLTPGSVSGPITGTSSGTSSGGAAGDNSSLGTPEDYSFLTICLFTLAAFWSAFMIPFSTTLYVSFDRFLAGISEKEKLV